MKVPGKTQRFLERVCEVLWAAALISLPITSFPLFSSLTGAIVAPLSILPLFLLFLLWGLPLILRRGKLPRESVPLVIFTLVAILSCAIAYFIYIPGFKGRTVPDQEIRALFTLAVGLTFFLATATWVNDSERLKNSWKYLTIGGIISLIWTGAQAIYIFNHATAYPEWLTRIQSWLVVRSVAFSPQFGRVNGFAYEASWFAHQMVMIYLPVWMAATYHKTSAFRFRIFHISLENLLLVLGLGAFFLSSPRIGLVSLFLIVMYFIVRLNISLYRKSIESFSKRMVSIKGKFAFANQTSIGVFTSLVIIAAYVLLIGGVFFIASQRDWRLTLLVSNPPSLKEIIGVLTLDQKTLLDLSHRFIFLERAVYWFNGWNIFNQYPWLGVGLGNAGFFFPKMAPAIGWASFEIRNALFYLPQLPNVKSLWFRLLAETGLVGFSIFITWLYVLFQSSRFSQLHRDSTIKTLALAGQLALLAFIGEGFSIDSFAMPYLWVIAGLVAAIAMTVRREPSQDQTKE